MARWWIKRPGVVGLVTDDWVVDTDSGVSARLARPITKINSPAITIDMAVRRIAFCWPMVSPSYQARTRTAWVEVNERTHSTI
jgi:hypothetical protein